MKMNQTVKSEPVFTHGGATAAHIDAYSQLRRSVLSCLLWEGEFYEDGKTIANRIVELADKVSDEKLASLCVEARKDFNLRHIPLLLLCCLVKKGGRIVGETIAETITRADELAEFLAIYWKDGKCPLSKQMKIGLGLAFRKFNEYQLAKYNQEGKIKLRDVLFLCHAKAQDKNQAALWKRLVNGELKTPDTWEVQLSSGKDKKATFERLIREEQLGYMALLRNLRNMVEARCDNRLIKDCILARKGADRVLPFRYIAATKAAPSFEPEIDQAFVAGMGQLPKLSGKTIVVIDVSGSMYSAALSAKSDMTRALAACALGSIAREISEIPCIYATAGSDSLRKHKTQLVPARRGMALVDAIHGLCRPLGGGGIFLKQVMDFLRTEEKSADRIIVITDEQDCGISSGDSPLNANPFGTKNYLINVASAKNGVGYKNGWIHIDGFSEAVFRFIYEIEKNV